MAKRKPAAEPKALAPTAGITMRHALEDPALLGGVLSGPSWAAWRILLIAAMDEALTDEERVMFTKLTGRQTEPCTRIYEFWAAIGRRGGKSRAIALLCVFVAVFIDHAARIVPGERPVVLCLAPTARQSRLVLDYIVGIIESTPLLAPLIANRTAESLELSNGVTIEVKTATFRGTRGFTTVAVVADEIAFWRSDESANPDAEILKALRPSLATTGGMLCAISSPHAKRGELYNTFKRHFGPAGDPLILVAKAPSLEMNPSLPKRVVDRAYEEDASAAAAEYGAEFRDDLEVFVSREVIEACVTTGVSVRAPLDGVSYFGFVDPSGGSSDSMTLAIAHNESGRVVVDCIGERKAPFSPDSVVNEFSATLKDYSVPIVTGDRYAGEWPRERFRVHGIEYRPADMNRRELYLAFLPLVNSGRIDLLDHPKSIAQFCGLERRTARSGKDSVDHAPGGHDDLANSVAGVAALAARTERKILFVAPIYFPLAQPRVPHQHLSQSGSGDPAASAYADRRSSGFTLKKASLWD
jgi:hypothetical protein